MPELRVHRSPWGDFPDVIVQTNMTKLQSHPAYRAAKEGDMVAAFQVVERVRKPSKVQWEADEIVAVAQIDRDKKNALPIAYAILLGREMGIPVNSTSSTIRIRLPSPITPSKMGWPSTRAGASAPVWETIFSWMTVGHLWRNTRQPSRIHSELRERRCRGFDALCQLRWYKTRIT